LLLGEETSSGLGNLGLAEGVYLDKELDMIQLDEQSNGLARLNQCV
jgi:hypothetical protein